MPEKIEAHECDFSDPPSRYCGVRICPICGRHKGLARCFCGWADDGGDGRQQLEDMGETIEEDC